MNPAIRTGVCPIRDYQSFKSDLENYGYIILSAKPGEGEADGTMIVTFQKVNRISRKQFMPSQDGWQ